MPAPPPGAGKTRLAVETAHRVAGRFRDGVAPVSLATASDATDLAGEVAVTLGLRTDQGSSLEVALVEALRDSSSLVWWACKIQDGCPGPLRHDSRRGLLSTVSRPNWSYRWATNSTASG